MGSPIYLYHFKNKQYPNTIDYNIGAGMCNIAYQNTFVLFRNPLKKQSHCRKAHNTQCKNVCVEPCYENSNMIYRKQNCTDNPAHPLIWKYLTDKPSKKDFFNKRIAENNITKYKQAVAFR